MDKNFDSNFNHKSNISNDIAILIFILIHSDSDFDREPNMSLISNDVLKLINANGNDIIRSYTFLFLNPYDVSKFMDFYGNYIIYLFIFLYNVSKLMDAYANVAPEDVFKFMDTDGNHATCPYAHMFIFPYDVSKLILSDENIVARVLLSYNSL